MDSIMIVIELIVIGITPFLFMKLAKRYKALSFAGPIIMCYIAGIIFANIPFIPWDSSLAMTISEVSVPIAIALLLFSTDIGKWVKLAKTTTLSFILVLVAATISSTAAGLIFADKLDEGWKIAGMLSGCYTGGTPNLMAIGMSLDVASESIVLVNMCDMLVGGAYFILLTTVMVRVYRKLLPPFDSKGLITPNEVLIPSMQPIFTDGKKQGYKQISIAIALALGVTGIAVGIAMLITGRMDTLTVILSVTTISIALSFWKKVKNIKGTSLMGQYAVYIFSIAIGSTVEFELFFNSSPTMLLFTFSVMMGALLIHLILCKIFKIDADTALITSTAGIYGPAFIAPVAQALGNREVIVSGLITGIIGYSVGNYLGIGIAYFIKLLM